MVKLTAEDVEKLDKELSKTKSELAEVKLELQQS